MYICIYIYNMPHRLRPHDRVWQTPPSIYLFICIYLFTYLSIHLSISLSLYIFIDRYNTDTVSQTPCSLPPSLCLSSLSLSLSLYIYIYIYTHTHSTDTVGQTPCSLPPCQSRPLIAPAWIFFLRTLHTYFSLLFLLFSAPPHNGTCVDFVFGGNNIHILFLGGNYIHIFQYFFLVPTLDRTCVEILNRCI